MRDITEGLSNLELADTYIKAVIDIDGKINEFNPLKESLEDVVEKIPTVLKDIYSGHYAELLHRLGCDENTIAEKLKESPVLGYKDGQEKFFIK